MICNDCGKLIGEGTMGTVLPLCQCQWRLKPQAVAPMPCQRCLELEEKCAYYDRTNKLQGDMLNGVIAERDALKVDAERYRWLSYNASYGIHEMLFGKPAFASTHKESDLAECIDEQIAAEEKNE